MKKQGILLLVCSVLTGSGVWVTAGAQGQEQGTRPPVNLHGVSFLTKEEGWAVGQLGKVFHTTDGGKRWTEQRTDTKFLLTAVDFVDATHGWVVGEQGVIFHSGDGGATWQRQQSGVTYPLFDVEFLDRERGWAVGHWGTVLRTEDGGQSWLEHPLSLALAERGPIEPAALHDVRDPQTGDLLAKAGQLLSRELITDIERRGISNVRIREDVVLNAVFFLDREHGWIAGERGLVLRTRDSGTSWERTVLPHPPAQLATATGKNGEADGLLILGDDVSDEELAAYGVVSPSPSLYGIFFTSPLQGWVVGQEGTIAWTQDGGRHWEFQPSATGESLYDIGVVGDTGWIVGDRGTVLVSSTAGQQWNKKDLGIESSFFWLLRLAVVPGDHAFLVGADGMTLSSGRASQDEIWVRAPGEK